MKKNKGFTLVELIAAMAIMVVLLSAFGYMLVAGSTNIKQDKQKVKVVSFTQYFMQTMKSYSKSYYSSVLGIKPPADPTKAPTVTSGYFYFSDKDELSDIITSDNIKNCLSGTGLGINTGTYNDMLNNYGGKAYGAYFELSSSAIMGDDMTTGTGQVVLQGYEYIRVYVKTADLKNKTKYSSDLTFYLGR